jgi:hypothetical protein
MSVRDRIFYITPSSGRRGALLANGTLHDWITENGAAPRLRSGCSEVASRPEALPVRRDHAPLYNPRQRCPLLASESQGLSSISRHRFDRDLTIADALFYVALPFCSALFAYLGQRLSQDD